MKRVLNHLGIIAFAFISLVGNGQAEVGITDREIHLGSSLPLEGQTSYLGIQTMHGAMSYIKRVNESGGIYNRQIKITAYDDDYDPAICVKNTKKLIHEDKVFALFSYVGTPTSTKAVPIIEKEAVPLVGVFSGAEFLRTPVKRHVFNIRGSYNQETAGIVNHFWNDLGLRKIAVFYQNDAFGQAGLNGVEKALQKF